MTDEHLIDGSRDYDCCRYFDLIKRIDSFYADGVITPDELARMSDMRGETLINYQVAQKLLKTMDITSPDYAKLGELIDYLRRCWQTMDTAYDRGVQMQREASSPTDKKLTLNLTREQADLVASVLPRKSRNIEAERVEISPAEEEKALNRVIRALRLLDRDQMNATRAHLAAEEHTRK